MTDQSTLLERIREYDTEALAEVYDQYYDRIYRYIYRYVGQAHVAEDLAANVFLRLLTTVRNGQCPDRNLSAWLYRVAHNMVVDTFRRKQTDELELAEWLESDEPSVIEAVQHSLQMERVRQALRQLTKSQRQVIVLKFLNGMDSREVAAILGKTEGAVDALQHRALTALRKALPADSGPGGLGGLLGGTGVHKPDDSTTTTRSRAFARLANWSLACLVWCRRLVGQIRLLFRVPATRNSEMADTLCTWEVAS